MLEVATVALTVGVAPLNLAIIYLIYSVIQAAAGALIVHRHPHHRIGWLLALYALQNAVMADAALAYGRRAAVEGWPLATYAELCGMLSWIFAVSGLILLFLLFPDGIFPAGRWRVVPWLWAVGCWRRPGHTQLDNQPEPCQRVCRRCQSFRGRRIPR